MGRDNRITPFGPVLEPALLCVMALGGAIWLGWQIGWPGGFDLDDPDFINPISAMIIGLLAFALWQCVKLVRAFLRHRAFGAVRLELDAPGHLRPGRPLEGRLRLQRKVHPTGPFRLTLTCHDVHEFDPGEDGTRFQSFPVWQAEIVVPATVDPTQGLPFRFDVPAAVGPDPVPSGILPPARQRSRFTVYLPGQRRVVANNHPPVERYWMLVATAPVKGVDFRVETAVPLRG